MEWQEYFTSGLREGEPMKLNDYQVLAGEFAIYPIIGEEYIYPLIGLTGEVGELAEKIKKLHRDNNGVMTPEIRAGIKKELGDIGWYFQELCTRFHFTMEEVCQDNLIKLSSRKERNVLNGEGDNR